MQSGVFFDMWEWLALPIYMLLVFLLALMHQKRKVSQNPLYKYYTWGLFARIGGAIFFGLIYEYYYLAGDTFGYFMGAVNMDKLLFHNPVGWFHNEFGASSYANYTYFDKETGYPLPYMYFDPRTFMVMRFINLLMIPALNSYLLATVIFAWFCYIGIWKMFLVFVHYYPKLTKQLAFGILFFPSVLFWGSGILKDTITLSCTGWIVYCIHSIFILRRKWLLHLIILLFNFYLVLVIKPYIIFALLPGSLMWIFSDKIYKIRNAAARVLIVPLIIVSCLGAGYFILSNLGSYLGKFSIDKVTTTAAVTQNDLKQSYYQGHSFDIGLEDRSLTGMLKKSPEAFVAGIYRPFIWETGNFVMLLSGLENTFLILLTLWMLLRTSIFTIINRLFAEPILFFTITYSIFFAASVGLTTANFGAMARFKTAYIPFFVVAIFILLNKRLQHTDDEALAEG